MRVGFALRLLAVFALIGSIAACQADGEQRGDERKLAALKRDPLATFRLPGGKVVLRLAVEEGTSFGKPNVAHFTRVFAYRDAGRARDAREVALDAAVASGWKMNFDREDPREPHFGAKTLATGEATLVIGSYEDEGIYKVSIGLEHTVCPKERCGSE